MKKIKYLLILISIVFPLLLKGTTILIPMDNSQTNHLKAYGVAYWVLQNNMEVDWLLNYRGGSFACTHLDQIERECKIRGVSYSVIADVQYNSILTTIADNESNTDIIKLHNAPKIAVYTPHSKLPWDDAVTLALSYAEIPYDKIYDKEIIQGELIKYDWLHLHHEDFTGQYGKFWFAHKNSSWYVQDVKNSEELAQSLGFSKVSQCKLAVAKKIKEYVINGGFLFAMCSAPDSFDVALAAEGVDICDSMFDGDPMDPQAQSKLNYDNCIAFTNFKISTNPHEYEISDIDVTNHRKVNENTDYFVLFEFSAKWDPVPTMLCQNHDRIIKGFMGQSTAFNRNKLKPNVLIMGENKSVNEVKYIHGELGQGTWTFFGGHDPEDYRHFVGDPPTELDLHPNSPGYRLILNNVLFPSAKKKKQKT
ncbi:asparagine synthetase B [Odoribacter sp. OttesenSCG-928-L07]|nr:asparagine synthetase B [Odoribacter sp. OttesenSCG-928-L07]